jgi:NTE family protein
LTPFPTHARPVFLLTGGGARAAYQVGVLEAIADIRLACGAGHEPNPFPIITGTSAGAINASALACGADNFDATVRLIARTWRGFHAAQVYRAGHLDMLRSGAKWLTLLSLGWILAKWRRLKPARCWTTRRWGNCCRLVPLERLPELIRNGHMQALAVTASSYSSGEHVTFFTRATGACMPWVRSQRTFGARQDHPRAPAGLQRHSIRVSGHRSAHQWPHRVFW